MNILFITEMKDLPFAGTRYSVPRQIESIAKIANVCWLNINKETIEEWENLPYYYSMKNMKCNSIDCLKEPFNKPDIIIFEEYYIYRNFSFILFYYTPCSLKNQPPILYFFIEKTKFFQNENRAENSARGYFLCLLYLELQHLQNPFHGFLGVFQGVEGG